MIEEINEIMADWLKPYLVCICADFEPADVLPDRMMFRCKCGGLMSFFRLENMAS